MDVAPAGVGGQALQLAIRLAALLDVEADHVRGEVHARRFQFLAQRAGIGVAGFLAVADQNDGGFLFGEAQLLRRHPHRGGDRGHALGIERVDLLANACGGVRADGLQHFDVGAIALAAVAVGDQAEVAAVPAIEHRIHRFAGDGDLRLAADLAPHRAGGVEHQHRLRLRGFSGMQAGGDQ